MPCPSEKICQKRLSFIHNIRLSFMNQFFPGKCSLLNTSSMTDVLCACTPLLLNMEAMQATAFTARNKASTANSTKATSLLVPQMKLYNITVQQESLPMYMKPLHFIPQRDGLRNIHTFFIHCIIWNIL